MLQDKNEWRETSCINHRAEVEGLTEDDKHVSAGAK